MKSSTFLPLVVSAFVMALGHGVSPAIAGPTLKQGEKFYGGKPRPPVTVTIQYARPVRPESDLSVQFGVKPTADCSELKTKIRVTGDLKLTSEAELSHATCGPVTVTPIVHVPSKGKGTVIADVSFVANGQQYSYSRSAKIHASDAPVPQKPSGPAMRDSKGEPIKVLKARES
ncbi:MAG TPA: hypothetical protein VJB59_13930 [Bdellovibrionota bacterium]|nr:hypothetical protein [Bdellovibrionota bacterium]